LACLQGISASSDRVSGCDLSAQFPPISAWIGPKTVALAPSSTCATWGSKCDVVSDNITGACLSRRVPMTRPDTNRGHHDFQTSPIDAPRRGKPCKANEFVGRCPISPISLFGCIPAGFRPRPRRGGRKLRRPAGQATASAHACPRETPIPASECARESRERHVSRTRAAAPVEAFA
jgi:hypothetical protein